MVMDMGEPPTHGTCFSRLGRGLWLLAAVMMLLSVSGCGALGWGAQIFEGERTRQVEARYEDLAGQRVAVMVAAADRTLAHYPQAREALTRLISNDLAENENKPTLKGIQLMSPEAILKYQDENPYWHTLRYSRLVGKLEVDRIVLVDLIDYRTHEPGNPHVYAGVIRADVGVIDASAEDPDNLVFNTQVNARYPENTSIGTVNRDERTVQLGALKQFTDKAAGLFYDHEVTE
jgi:hypothetical protein